MAIEKIEKVSKISKALQAQEPIEKIPDKDRFDALMQQQTAVESTQTQETANASREQHSLIDAVGDASRANVNVNKYPSADQLVAQTQTVVKQIDSIRNTLATSDLELNGSVRNLLRNKLSHVDDNLKVALQKAGVEYTPPEVVAPVKTNPIEHFLGLLTHSQFQLEHLANDVQIMHANRAEINPANMLLIQIKVGFIQQEMEFFTSVLTKSLDSTKTIMNVQI
ncbi:putative uncharacterized protein [Parachlamydia acanthamoebae UV-7]|uniref:Uncharacterized protein n=2 Tax=Parachlamydia acanthamoebae TaxID=83552 RepID=F8KX48_PARAV|nr:hypothetical protein [Parachlamydia acanthamoebae]CCB85515.1 putative uncharacterized protein [Parachlamydia acanthamoebae UV-7]